MRSPAHDERVAAYEAGHAVAAVPLKLSLRYVTMRGRGTDGSTVTGERKGVAKERSIVCALSGPAAERAFYGIDVLGVGDKWFAKKVAPQLAGPDAETLYQSQGEEAERRIGEMPRGNPTNA